MERLLEYRFIITDENKENRMSCTVNLLVSTLFLVCLSCPGLLHTINCGLYSHCVIQLRTKGTYLNYLLT